MSPKCPLFTRDDVSCRIKPDSQFKWPGKDVRADRSRYIQNYCETDYYVDCSDYEAYLENTAKQKGKILVVDDEQALTETIQGFFGARGYQIHTALSAEEAIKVIRSEQPVLALVDIKLPGMNGIELLEHLSSNYPHIKRIVMTAFDEENKRKCEQIGIDGFFAKPIALDALKRKVAEVLAEEDRKIKTFVRSQVLEGVPQAKLLFVLEVLPHEQDRMSRFLRDFFTTRSRCGGNYTLEFAYSVDDTITKLNRFEPDIVLINFDSLFKMSCGELASRILESEHRPKEILVYGLDLEAQDKAEIEQLGLQYIDQRNSFVKLVTMVKQAALRHGANVAAS